MTKKTIILAVITFVFLLLHHMAAKAQNYISNSVKTSFFSSTPIEDIKAASSKTAAILISKTGEFAFQIRTKSFEFEKKLMQEHFNENYLESDQYPAATFKGVMAPIPDWTKNGEYNVTAKGTLTVHGVSKARNIAAKVLIREGTVNISAAFDVACADHNIDIPTLVFTKIAKVISVKVNGTLNPKP